MNSRVKQMLFLIPVVMLITTLWRCGDSEIKYHNNLEKINALSLDSIEYQISSLDLIGNEQLMPILNEANDTLFLSPKRTIHLKSFPCSECHSISLEQLKSQSKDDIQNAHWNIEMAHAPTSTMNCQTCHSGNDSESLISITDEAIEIDHSYQLCGQCHSTQLKDWKGGAHGKRKAGWVNPRISLTCVNCHNPHSPSFEKRWPSRHNTKKTRDLDK